MVRPGMLVIPISDVTQELAPVQVRPVNSGLVMTRVLVLVKALQDKTESWPHAFVLKPVNMPELRRHRPQSQ